MGVLELDQRRKALIVANEARLRVAGFKRHMAGLTRRQGPRRASRILLHEPELVGEMEVYKFLEAIPGFGAARVRMVCQSLPVWPFRRISQLTDNERARLARRILQVPQA